METRPRSAALVSPRRSWPGMLGCAMAGVIGGGVLGAVLLTLLPVPHVKVRPVAADEDDVYFIEGSSDEAKAGEVWKKARLFLHGGTIQVIEDELNVAAASARVESPEPDMFTLGSPNFRLFGGHVQVAVPVTVTALGLEREVLVQMSGVLVRREKEFTLAPREVYVGSCALHSVPGMGEWLVARLWASSEVPGRVRTAWQRLRNARVDGEILKLEAQP